MASWRQQRWCCLLVLAAWCLSAAALSAAQSTSPPAADPLQSKCQGDFGKLTDCMDYATGHSASPSSTCCGDVGDTEKARPDCLCYIIQQTHKGQNQVQSLGLRFDRLIAMPAACKLPNANVSLCINLLNLKPGSPDYDLFANASKITPSTNPASDSTAGSGFKLQAGILGRVALAVISAVVSSLF